VQTGSGTQAATCPGAAVDRTCHPRSWSNARIGSCFHRDSATLGHRAPAARPTLARRYQGGRSRYEARSRPQARTLLAGPTTSISRSATSLGPFPGERSLAQVEDVRGSAPRERVAQHRLIDLEVPSELLCERGHAEAEHGDDEVDRRTGQILSQGDALLARSRARRRRSRGSRRCCAIRPRAASCTAIPSTGSCCSRTPNEKGAIACPTITAAGG
jgi:hypothetical protein